LRSSRTGRDVEGEWFTVVVFGGKAAKGVDGDVPLESAPDEALNEPSPIARVGEIETTPRSPDRLGEGGLSVGLTHRGSNGRRIKAEADEIESDRGVALAAPHLTVGPQRGKIGIVEDARSKPPVDRRLDNGGRNPPTPEPLAHLGHRPRSVVTQSIDETNDAHRRRSNKKVRYLVSRDRLPDP
jgi:hypothetical protein